MLISVNAARRKARRNALYDPRHFRSTRIPYYPTAGKRLSDHLMLVYYRLFKLCGFGLFRSRTAEGVILLRCSPAF